MTFSCEEVRLAFHQLSTETQVAYANFEQRLAEREQAIHVEHVSCNERCSEVVIRITQHFKRDVAARAG